MDYDVLIIGGGVSGTALLYVLTKFSSIKKVGLIERRKDFGLVASHVTQNSQTLHFGDIETNYSFQKAKDVSQGARYVRNFLDFYDKKNKAHKVVSKMVLAVGKKECQALKKRYEEFKKLFPKLQLIQREKIAELEPKVVEERDVQEELVALYTPDGYTVDYHQLSKLFVEETVSIDSKLKKHIHLNASVQNIQKINGGFSITLPNKILTAQTVIVNAGAMSIWLAKKLGYAHHLSIFSVAGNFYRGPQVLNGKVYTMQLDKLPFAAVHGDPDVRKGGYTRFGPSAKPILRLERDNKKSRKHYFKTFKFNKDGLLSVLKIAFSPTYFMYMLHNYTYEIPFIGPRLFARNAQKIVPSIKSGDMVKEKGYGGTRPQIIDTTTHSISMGEARIEGKHINFNITPSPGASTCLANAKRDAHDLVDWLGESFDEKKMDQELLVH